MASKNQKIPTHVKEDVLSRVAVFNTTQIEVRKPMNPNSFTALLMRMGLMGTPQLSDIPIGYYFARFRGRFLYLDRMDHSGKPSQICRLGWTGDMENWDFAIYRHSRNFYDPEEWFFPGAGHVDGTIEGAMRAGIEAYPL